MTPDTDSLVASLRQLADFQHMEVSIAEDAAELDAVEAPHEQ